MCLRCKSKKQEYIYTRRSRMASSTISSFKSLWYPPNCYERFSSIVHFYQWTQISMLTLNSNDHCLEVNADTSFSGTEQKWIKMDSVSWIEMEDSFIKAARSAIRMKGARKKNICFKIRLPPNEKFLFNIYIYIYMKYLRPARS